MVGLVAPLPPQLGGVASVAEWLLEHEREIGYGYDAFDLWRPPEDEAGGRVRLSAAARQARLLARFLRWLASSPRLVHYSVAVTPTGLTRDLLFLTILRAAGRRTIAHVHVVAEESPFWRAGMRALARITVARVMIAPWAVAALSRLGVSATYVLNPVRVEPPETISRKANGRLRILFVGTFGERKGSHELVEALAALKEDGLDAELTFVGREEHRGEEAALRHAARVVGVAAAVTFAGVVPRDALHAFYERADVFCLPSRFEGLPMALLEAMAFAVPVVATPVGGIADVVVEGETGLLVPPGNVAELGAALRTLAGDSTLRTKMGVAGRERVMRLAGGDTIAREWRRVYDEHSR
jgi:glycosyltransferase involved in cell wall biosynthesis